MKPLDTYLTSLREIRSSGEAVDETSYLFAPFGSVLWQSSRSKAILPRENPMIKKSAPVIPATGIDRSKAKV